MAKITQDQADILEHHEIIKGSNYPWGEECPSCHRPHVFTYSDGTKLCDKCDELVVVGASIQEAQP